ncbi:MAG: hypothetical protein ACI4I9_02725 [Porcipelethomonas sp.]
MFRIKKKALSSCPDGGSRFESFSRIAVSILMLAVMGFLTAVSLLHTTGMEIIKEGEGIETVVYSIKEKLESVIYYNDNFVFNVIYLAVGFALCFLIVPRMNKIPLWAETAFIFVWTVVLGCIWVNSSMVSPTEDSAMVTCASIDFAENNFQRLGENYYSNYSFQLGYILFNEILIRLHNIFLPFKNLIFLEIFNVIFLAVTYVGLIMINNRIFTDKRIRHLTVVILALSVQPLIFSVFLYGIIPGLMFAVWAVYFEIVWLQKSNIPCGILSAVFIALAVMIKSNYLITLIAMLIIAFVKMFGRRQFIKDIIFIVLAASLSMGISPAVKALYESRSDMEIGDSIPYTSWIAMGLNESDLAPGWYNYNYTVANFEKNDFDADKAGKESMDNIKHRLNLFLMNPQYANDFFYKKTVSQWNETSYQSIWNNEVRFQYKEKGKLSAWVCGKGEKPVKKYMDIFTQIIFAGSLIGVAACLKNKNLLTVFIPLIVFGGFLYHTISEGKSQYIIPYYILLTGFAAYGICTAYDLFCRKFSSRGRIVSAVFGFKTGETNKKIQEEVQDGKEKEEEQEKQ